MRKQRSVLTTREWELFCVKCMPSQRANFSSENETEMFFFKCERKCYSAWCPQSAGCPSPTGPAHPLGGPAGEEDVPSSPPGVWGSQALVHHWLLFTQAMLCWPLPVSVLVSQPPGSRRHHLCHPCSSYASLLTLIFLDRKMETNGANPCVRSGVRSAAEPMGRLLPVSAHVHAGPGPGRSFSFRRCLKTWLAWMKGFSGCWPAEGLLGHRCRAQRASCCISQCPRNPGPWAGGRRAAQLRSLKPAPTPHTARQPGCSWGCSVCNKLEAPNYTWTNPSLLGHTYTPSRPNRAQTRVESVLASNRF